MLYTIGNAVSVGIFLGLLIAFVIFQLDRIQNKKIEKRIAMDDKTQKIIKEVKDAKQEEIKSSRDPTADWRAEVGAIRRAVNGSSETSVRQAPIRNSTASGEIQGPAIQPGSLEGTGDIEERGTLQTGVTGSPTKYRQKIRLHRPADF